MLSARLNRAPQKLRDLNHVPSRTAEPPPLAFRRTPRSGVLGFMLLRAGAYDKAHGEAACGSILRRGARFWTGPSNPGRSSHSRRAGVGMTRAAANREFSRRAANAFPSASTCATLRG